MKLCLIYNFAQHYRTNIFTLMDKEFDVDFLFGDSMGDVKKMDYSLLHGNVLYFHGPRGGNGYLFYDCDLQYDSSVFRLLAVRKGLSALFLATHTSIV